MKARLWTVERPTREEEKGKVLIDDLKPTRSEARREVARRLEHEPEAGWSSAEIEVDVPVESD